MGNLLGGLGRRRSKPRQFNYQPRFHSPEKEAREERLRRRVKMESNVRRGQQPKFIAVAVLLLLALFIYMQLG
ncbi:MAG: hypothetical protein AAF089_18430 [Bacteroidota bacterium]